jgi:hypothetical protein
VIGPPAARWRCHSTFLGPKLCGHHRPSSSHASARSFSWKPKCLTFRSAMRGMIFRSRSELPPELVRRDTSVPFYSVRKRAAAAGLISAGAFRCGARVERRLRRSRVISGHRTVVSDLRFKRAKVRHALRTSFRTLHRETACLICGLSARPAASLRARGRGRKMAAVLGAKETHIT